MITGFLCKEDVAYFGDSAEDRISGQAVIGFAMSAKCTCSVITKVVHPDLPHFADESLQGSIAGFAVLYGIYLSFGEFGPVSYGLDYSRVTQLMTYSG